MLLEIVSFHGDEEVCEILYNRNEYYSVLYSTKFYWIETVTKSKIETPLNQKNKNYIYIYIYMGVIIWGQKHIHIFWL